AHRIAMLDHLARGRFYWGIGGGAIPTDLALFGLQDCTPAQVRERSAEALDVILTLWASDGTFSYRGKFFEVTAPSMDPVRERGQGRAREVLGRNYVRHQYPNRRGTSQMAACKIDPSMPDDALDVDYMMEHLWIVGDPEECADRIRRLYESVGGFGMLLAITTDSDNP